MTPAEFQRQMNRLVDQFGKSTYGTERCTLIWREIQDFSGMWWEKTVDKFLLTCRQAPLMDELASEIGAERERLYKQQKKQHEQDAKDFYSGAYQPDDVKTICQYMVKRIMGEVSDEDYAQFLKHLKEAANSNPATKDSCRDCDNSGLVFAPGNYVYRCYCRHGQARQENYPIFQR